MSLDNPNAEYLDTQRDIQQIPALVESIKGLSGTKDISQIVQSLKKIRELSKSINDPQVDTIVSSVERKLETYAVQAIQDHKDQVARGNKSHTLDAGLYTLLGAVFQKNPGKYNPQNFDVKVQEAIKFNNSQLQKLRGLEALQKTHGANTVQLPTSLDMKIVEFGIVNGSIVPALKTQTLSNHRVENGLIDKIEAFSSKYFEDQIRAFTRIPKNLQLENPVIITTRATRNETTNTYVNQLQARGRVLGDSNKARGEEMIAAMLTSNHSQISERDLYDTPLSEGGAIATNAQLNRMNSQNQVQNETRNQSNTFLLAQCKDCSTSDGTKFKLLGRLSSHVDHAEMSTKLLAYAQKKGITTEPYLNLSAVGESLGLGRAAVAGPIVLKALNGKLDS